MEISRSKIRNLSTGRMVYTSSVYTEKGVLRKKFKDFRREPNGDIVKITPVRKLTLNLSALEQMLEKRKTINLSELKKMLEKLAPKEEPKELIEGESSEKFNHKFGASQFTFELKLPRPFGEMDRNFKQYPIC